MQLGVNQEDILEMNRSLVIHLLRENGWCSRAQLAKLTGLKPTTITNIINDFIKWGLVNEEGLISGGKGRRAIRITLNSTDYRVIGVRLSRKYFLIGLFDISGKQIEVSRQPIDVNETPDKVFAKIKEGIRNLIDANKNNQMLAIGFAIPGPFIRKEGRIMLMSGFPNWQHIFIKAELEKEFNLPTFLEHDAKVGALAECWNMKAGADKTLVYVTAGQGVGAGMILGGKLYKGALGAAGEIGHMCIDIKGPQCVCGNRGCLELYCSSGAFTKAVNEKLASGESSILKNNCSFKEAAAAVKCGDSLAVSEYKKICEYLAVGVVNIINLINPDVVVIGDELSTVSAKILLETVKESVSQRVLPRLFDSTSIMVSDKENDSILCGASIMAIEEIFKKPSVFSN